MTLTRAYLLVISTAFSFGVVGAGIGYSIGQLAPAYYRTVLVRPPETTSEISTTGLALGLIQGTMAGLAVGLAIVLILTWHAIRMAQIEASSKATG